MGFPLGWGGFGSGVQECCSCRPTLPRLGPVLLVEKGQNSARAVNCRGRCRGSIPWRSSARSHSPWEDQGPLLVVSSLLGLGSGAAAVGPTSPDT